MKNNIIHILGAIILVILLVISTKVRSQTNYGDSVLFSLKQGIKVLNTFTHATAEDTMCIQMRGEILNILIPQSNKLYRYYRYFNDVEHIDTVRELQMMLIDNRNKLKKLKTYGNSL